MRLNKQTTHAIRILIECAHSRGSLTKVGAIAERLGITPQNAFKIVHLLSRAGFLDAVRGRNGGVRLARTPDLIRIGDVVRAMEAMRAEAAPANESGDTPPVTIDHVFDQAFEAFAAVLDKHTLEDMANAAQATDATAKGRAKEAREGTLRMKSL